MKKKTILKYFFITLAAGFAGLVTYANARTIPLAENVKSIRLATFDISGMQMKSTAEMLQKQISSSPGVTACTFNYEGKVAAVAYHPDEINQAKIMDIIDGSGNCTASPKMFLDGPKCPVDGVFGFWQRMLHSLRIV